MAHLGGYCVCVCCGLCLCCLQNNPVFSCVTLFHILKNENYEICFFFQISLLNILRLEKIMTGKKRYCVSFFGQCSWVSPYFIFWKMKIMSYVFWQVTLSMKLWPEKIMTGKKSYYVSFFCFAGKSFLVLRTYLEYNTGVSFFVVVPAISELPPKQSSGK